MDIIRFTDQSNNTFYGTDFDGKYATVLDGSPFKSFRKTKDKSEVIKLLTPIKPTSIICIGLNYRQHANETGLPIPEYPVIFMKNIASIANPFDDIKLPESCIDPLQVDYEVELAVVIGKDAKNVSKENANNYIAGYTIGNDISARTWQFNNGGQWVKGKSFDTFCPLGPVMVKDVDPENMNIKTVLNGEVMQNSNTSDMIFSVYELIELLSCDMTLIEGTVILTGTPGGVGFAQNPQIFLKDGDKLDLTIEGIGTLSNNVVE
ncbi:MAG: fumarylacetoacetate hydrolase family protein [Desulfobacterales bacterium]|nr:fumarylacetoacetate hydrolase family protein [Desulfobacterales bacterium]MCP4162926.1 fumarylacetoacetate hydrolase family protein [Deltaproteobacteria bacterium]